MRTTKKRMHGRRRRRSPLHSNGADGQIGEHNGKPIFKTTEEAFEWHKKNANDESSGGAVNKNATTAASEASEKVAQTQNVGETAKVGAGSTGSHDTTHSHPPAAIEGKKEAEEEGMSPRERARNQAQAAVQKLGGNWGQRTFGW